MKHHTFTPSEDIAIANVMEQISEDWQEQFEMPMPEAEPHLILFLVRGIADAIGFSPDKMGFAAYFVYRFSPDFDWQFGSYYMEGSHPDYGGGQRMRDIEGCTIDYAMGLDRIAWVALIGKDAVEQIEAWAIDNLEPGE